MEKLFLPLEGEKREHKQQMRFPDVYIALFLLGFLSLLEGKSDEYYNWVYKWVADSVSNELWGSSLESVWVIADKSGLLSPHDLEGVSQGPSQS